jgi:hypothetical protein
MVRYGILKNSISRAKDHMCMLYSRIAALFNICTHSHIYLRVAPVLRAQNDEGERCHIDLISTPETLVVYCSGAQALLRLVDRLKYYPLILCVCYLFATANRVYDSVHPARPLFWLTLLQV